MCSIGYHICVCGEEFKCHQHNRECPTMNGFDDLCGRCQRDMEGSERELEIETRRAEQQDAWLRELGDYE